MDRKLTATCGLLLITIFIVSGSSVMSQGPQAAPVLVKIDLPAEGDLQRVEAGGLAVYAHLTTEDEHYLIAAATEDALLFLAKQGLAYRVLDDEFVPGQYYLVYPRYPDQLSLIPQHGRLLYFDGLRALIRAPADGAEKLPALGLEIRWLPDHPIRLSPTVEGVAYESLGQPDPLVAEMMAQVDSAVVYQYDGDLSGENQVTIGGQPYTISTRYSYSGEPIEKATQFVYEHFQSLGLEVAYHNYNWSGYNWRNVVATKPGLTDPDDIYIVCAHVDSISEPAYRYTDAPGADDNASGTTAVMIAADILSQYGFDYTIRFVAFTGEEQGLRGSHAYAQDAYYEGDDILGVLNLDMIAYDSNADSIFELHAGSGAGSIAIANLFADVVDTYDVDLVPQIITYGATNRSDHASFWDYGYSAILGIEDWQDFTPYYHTTGDQLSTLNIPYFTEFVRASVGTIATMSSPLGYVVEGTVRFWQDGVGVPDVLLTLTGDQVYTDLSQADGGYDVSGFAAGDYILTPSKSDGVRGISAYDASLALQHEAGLITLSGYAATAGDVDKIGGVTSLDASYILQKAADLVTLPFPGAGLVWEFDPATRSYTDLSGYVSGQDFTATLLGDVSGSWSEGVGQAQLANTASLTLPHLYAEPGERITVTLEIAPDQAEVYGADVVVSYDPTVVSATSASAGDAARDFLTESNLNQPGLVRAAVAGAQPITDDGHLLELVFDVVGELGDTSPLEITAAELNEGGVTVPRQDGSVSVVNFPHHDFNRDCNVDIADIMQVANRWHMTDADPGWDARYDLDGDGEIDIVDIMIVAVDWGETCW